MNLSSLFTWQLIVGLILGYLVIPRLMLAINSRKAAA